MRGFFFKSDNTIHDICYTTTTTTIGSFSEALYHLIIKFYVKKNRMQFFKASLTDKTSNKLTKNFERTATKKLTIVIYKNGFELVIKENGFNRV